MPPVELKPCPFCGESPRSGSLGLNGFEVYCFGSRCRLRPSVIGRSVDDVVAAWNRRHEPEEEEYE